MMEHQTTRGGRAAAVMLAGSLLVLTILLAGCLPEVTPTVTPSAGHGPDTTRTSATISSESPSSVPSADDLLAQALTWIEAEPSQVVFGPYTVHYDRGAASARLMMGDEAHGEPIVPWPCWWSAKGSYYYLTEDGSFYRVTAPMAESMRKAGYPGAEEGLLAVVTMNLFADPHRLLQRARAVSPPQAGEGGLWTIEVAVEGTDLVDLALAAEDLARYTEGVRYDLKLRVATRWGDRKHDCWVGGNHRGAHDLRVAPSRDGPDMPGDWVDLDQATLEKALREGWRASPADAAADVGFPVFWLGESYEGLTPRSTHLTGRAVLIEYASVVTTQAAGESTTTTLSPAGYILFQYSEDDVPESEKPFVAEKTIVGEFGDGTDRYSVYRTAKGQPGRSILVKRGETYISITATRAGADVTEQLLAAAAALQPATKMPTR